MKSSDQIPRSRILFTFNSAGACFDELPCQGSRTRGRTGVWLRRLSLWRVCSFDGKMRINWFVVNRSGGLLPCAQVNYTAAAGKSRRNCEVCPIIRNKVSNRGFSRACGREKKSPHSD